MRRDEAAVSQQLEETNWREGVRAFVARNPGARAIDIANALGCTEAQALGALSEIAWEIPASDLPQVLDEIRAWGRTMVLVRNQDAVAEVEVPGGGGQVSGAWLNWIGDGYNLHIRSGATHRVLALVRAGKRGPTYSFNLVNRKGLVFCRFYTRDQVDSQRFLAFCEPYQPGRSGGSNADG
jgi:putative heme iron utilization protein